MNGKLILAALAAHCLTSGSGRECRAAFRPAEFRGVPISRYSERQILQHCGPPIKTIWSYWDEPNQRGLIFKDCGEHRGEYIFIFSRRTLVAVEIRPENLTRTAFQAWARYPVRACSYSMDHCLEWGGSSPIYDDPGGSQVIYQVPERGLEVDWNGDRITSIVLWPAPLGERKSRCVKRVR